MCCSKTYLLSTNLKKIELLLKKFPEFLQVHRSYIINLNQVEEIAELALFIYQHKIPIGRSYKEYLRKRLPIFRIST
ncbi:MAG: LytTR family transcriptional regulator DNA-binding domain-containing protein [Saprospiraceae bacterium]